MKPEYPSSFESEFGSVEYKVHVAFELENEPDQTIESPFKVIKFSNLNTYASLRVNICFIAVQTYLRLDTNRWLDIRNCLWFTSSICDSSQYKNIVWKIEYMK